MYPASRQQLEAPELSMCGSQASRAGARRRTSAQDLGSWVDFRSSVISLDTLHPWVIRPQGRVAGEERVAVSRVAGTLDLPTEGGVRALLPLSATRNWELSILAAPEGLASFGHSQFCAHSSFGQGTHPPGLSFSCTKCGFMCMHSSCPFYITSACGLFLFWLNFCPCRPLCHIPTTKQQ